MCESEILSKTKLSGTDEDIDNTKTEDIDNIDNIETEDNDISKTAYIDNTKADDTDISKTEDIDICETEDKNKTKTKTEDKDKPTTKTKTEDKDENKDRGRNEFIQMFHRAMKSRDKKGNWKREQIVWIFWNDGHVSELCKSGYIVMVTMHTQGLKSFAHILVRCFLLENIGRPYQKINQTPTYILMS